MNLVKSTLAALSLIAFWAMGQWLSEYVALPGTLLGLLLLFFALICINHVPDSLVVVSQFCLRHMSFFFIPPLLAAWFYIEQLGDKLWLFLLSIALSTFLSLLLTTWLGQRIFSVQPQTADAGKESK
jgi:holin-like protein